MHCIEVCDGAVKIDLIHDDRFLAIIQIFKSEQFQTNDKGDISLHNPSLLLSILVVISKENILPHMNLNTNFVTCEPIYVLSQNLSDSVHKEPA